MNTKTETRICQNCKKDFTIEPEDFNFYEKMAVPAPTWCPDCRLQRRLTFRNERTFYKRPCDLCGVSTISRYDPSKGELSYCGECWWSDKWNPASYGQGYDFSRPFFEQFSELMKKVPHQNLSVSYKTLTNSDFTNMNHYLKNCYYIFNSDYDERCLYGEEIEHSADCMDMTMAENTQLAYESVNCNKCYQIYYSVDCESSHDIWFSKNLVGCSNCFSCINLRGQQYCIFNEKYSREDYLKKLQKFNLGSYAGTQGIKKEAAGFWLKFPNKYMHGIQNLDSTGDYIYNSKYVKKSFVIAGGEYCKYCFLLIGKNNKECYDFTQFGENTEKVYESLVSGNGISNVIGGIVTLEGRNIRYSVDCRDSNRFGCVGIRDKKHYIFNKEYTKEEYENLVPKIVEHMNSMPYIDKKGCQYVYGDFFPTEISPYSYNETTAQEFFPLTKQEAGEQGYSWKEPKERNYKITIESENLPDNIKDIPDDMVSAVIGCEHGGKCKEQCTIAFKIIEPELQFYKSQNLPLPHLCPNCRHYQRVLNRNPNKFWHRQCMCDKKHVHHEGQCEVEFETSYAPERPEIVYCEKCYQQEVY
ncbi:MAG: hypothetical protein UU58_C0009G0013 [Candidatus Nomurabacteria bacterium GW2011_GWA2_41_25]|uniref:Zinc-binding domain-containing protein n=1 Tax=Candidatus Nomurabacteria bacterium GW2011_GWA2_41_25 TaxID=1618736 RepID=A0A0G0Y430_9BACT|nr:MAG: hypothetical protein UU58_C0009G0013 [Candidatus Nomurabacteria bacterium GW2011_GWA2_41_25]